MLLEWTRRLDARLLDPIKTTNCTGPTMHDDLVSAQVERRVTVPGLHVSVW